MYNFDYSKLPIKNIQKIFPIAGGYVNRFCCKVKNIANH